MSDKEQTTIKTRAASFDDRNIQTYKYVHSIHTYAPVRACTTSNEARPRSEKERKETEDEDEANKGRKKEPGS